MTETYTTGAWAVSPWARIETPITNIVSPPERKIPAITVETPLDTHSISFTSPFKKTKKIDDIAQKISPKNYMSSSLRKSKSPNCRRVSLVKA